MASNLGSFLTQLSQNPTFLSIFQADPQGTLDKTNLTPSEKAVLLSGNASAINSALAGEGLGSAALKIVIHVHIEVNI